MISVYLLLDFLSMTLTLSRILVINRFGRNFLGAIVTHME